MGVSHYKFKLDNQKSLPYLRFVVMYVHVWAIRTHTVYRLYDMHAVKVAGNWPIL